eukprot:jgi/Bigna1/70502/fgenesh1_pg.12_\
MNDDIDQEIVDCECELLQQFHNIPPNSAVRPVPRRPPAVNGKCGRSCKLLRPVFHLQCQTGDQKEEQKTESRPGEDEKVDEHEHSVETMFDKVLSSFGCEDGKVKLAEFMNEGTLDHVDAWRENPMKIRKLNEHTNTFEATCTQLGHCAMIHMQKRAIQLATCCAREHENIFNMNTMGVPDPRLRHSGKANLDNKNLCKFQLFESATYFSSFSHLASPFMVNSTFSKKEMKESDSAVDMADKRLHKLTFDLDFEELERKLKTTSSFQFRVSGSGLSDNPLLETFSRNITQPCTKCEFSKSVGHAEWKNSLTSDDSIEKLNEFIFKTTLMAKELDEVCNVSIELKGLGLGEHDTAEKVTNDEDASCLSEVASMAQKAQNVMLVGCDDHMDASTMLTIVMKKKARDVRKKLDNAGVELVVQNAIKFMGNNLPESMSNVLTENKCEQDAHHIARRTKETLKGLVASESFLPKRTTMFHALALFSDVLADLEAVCGKKPIQEVDGEKDADRNGETAELKKAQVLLGEMLEKTKESSRTAKNFKSAKNLTKDVDEEWSRVSDVFADEFKQTQDQAKKAMKNMNKNQKIGRNKLSTMSGGSKKRKRHIHQQKQIMAPVPDANRNALISGAFGFAKDFFFQRKNSSKNTQSHLASALARAPFSRSSVSMTGSSSMSNVSSRSGSSLSISAVCTPGTFCEIMRIAAIDLGPQMLSSVNGFSSLNAPNGSTLSDLLSCVFAFVRTFDTLELPEPSFVDISSVIFLTCESTHACVKLTVKACGGHERLDKGSLCQVACQHVAVGPHDLKMVQ